MVKQYRVTDRSFINGRLCEVGEIVSLHIDSPGSNLKEVKVGAAVQAPLQTQTGTQTPTGKVVAKHGGGGHWRIEDEQGERVGDFSGTKAEAEAEAARLNAGDPDLDDQGGDDLPDA